MVKQIRIYDSRHQRALRDTREAPGQYYWYGLAGLDLVLTIIFAVAAAATPQGASFWERVGAGLIAGLAAFAIGVIIFAGGTYLWFWWHAPIRMLSEARGVVLTLVKEVLDVRDLTSLIERLKQCQSDTMVILGKIALQGQHVTQQEFEAWNDNLSALMIESGDEHYARYTARAVRVSLPPAPGETNDISPIYMEMIEVLTDVITSVSVKREQVGTRAVAQTQLPE